MSFTRIKGLLIQEFYITKNSIEVLIDVYFWSFIAAIVFGFVTVYLSEEIHSKAAEYIFLGLLLWEIVRVMQYSVSVGSLWNIWSRNLSNMFIAPLTLKEYVIAYVISGLWKAFSAFVLVSVLAYFFFHFNITKIGIVNLLFYFVNLCAFSVSIGLILLGLIFQYGSRIQAFAWSLVFLFQPLCAAIFPLKVLPEFLQKIALCFPLTYIFEAARANLDNPSIHWEYILIAILENCFYLIISWFIFVRMFNKSKKTGQFVRNEG